MTWLGSKDAGPGRFRAVRALIGGALVMALPAAMLTFLPASPASAAACSPTESTASGIVTVTFSSAGTCDWAVPAGVTSVDVLVVGGGGGGGGSAYQSNGGDQPYNLLGGNGGGGGYVNLTTNLSVSASISVIVGARGTGGAAGNGAQGGSATAGGSSSFGAVTALGGGAGAPADYSTRGATLTQGGSSGSTVNGTVVPRTGGSSGAAAIGSDSKAVGGGGAGAGGNGVNGSGTSAGNGGIGYVPSAGHFSGTSTAYGGGGAGGFYGSGNQDGTASDGGANAVLSQWASVSGSTYILDAVELGGGGAGGSSKYSYPTTSGFLGGRGGTGVVVVKYAAPVTTAPTFTASTPPTTGTAGTAYASYTFTASGSSPITFTADSGSLPSGLTLSSGGVLSGTPTAAGTYTFTVKAANGTSPDATTSSITITITAAGGGGSSSGGGGSSTPVVDPTPTPTPTPTPSPTATVAAAVALDPIPNQANPNIPAGGVPQGGSVFLVNGVPAQVSVAPNAQQAATTLDISGPDFTMKLSGTGDDADPLGLTAKNALILQSKQSTTRSGMLEPRSGRFAKCVLRTPLAVSSGTGFKPGSPVRMYILPSTYIGELTADASGNYSGSLPVPVGVLAGDQTLQANGFSPAGSVRSLSLGIQVKQGRVVTTKSEKANVFFDPLSPVISPEGQTTLDAMVRKARKQGVRTVVVGFVQETATTSNDDSLSTQRARAVAAYLRDRGLKGAYSIRGNGVAGTGDAARRVNVSVTYQSGC